MQANGSIYGYVFDYANKRISGWQLPNDFGNQGRIYWGGQQIAYRAWNRSTYFDHQDWIGTERLRTDHAGVVSSTYKSLPWGDGYTANENDPTGNALDNLQFAQLDRDSETETHHAQFRQYSSGLGRWLSPDPYDGSHDASNPQSFNRYAYVKNPPLMGIDPSGLEEFDCFPSSRRTNRRLSRVFGIYQEEAAAVVVMPRQRSLPSMTWSETS
ncbi:RHS repeat domain-containing protein [Terriglobus albidus]|uniref:RHS repeat domain-containing protein n=1 Tax=Terriglobus albidus TaxID=1592106 RepID=UPI0021E07098|nr:RHS repeat-associated core domain-containing protein [Terriglobus albidus]